MSVVLWIQIALLAVALCCTPVTFFLLRKAGRLNRIAAKLRAGEALTSQERQLLDRVR